MKTDWGFFGTLQDYSKRAVKYKEDGKVVGGPSRGNLLDIDEKASETPQS